ncbi:hypothetical protein [Olivibacter sitiensis]|uniref:hypothetical protein n=1 Tax=Olivibacter sitiensis TaxID=376470 RepID=UPI0004234840|nr:hypothetical protein [Olivibacter sitiensis]
MKRNRKKMWIVFACFVAASMLLRMAFATVYNNVSVWLICVGVLFAIAAIVSFALYFKE